MSNLNKADLERMARGYPEDILLGRLTHQREVLNTSQFGTLTKADIEMSVSVLENEVRRRTVRLIEEVPGVPERERYFVCGGKFDPRFLEPIEYPHFSTKADAEAFLKKEGVVDFVFEPFRP